jgi:hypothetical protein
VLSWAFCPALVAGSFSSVLAVCLVGVFGRLSGSLLLCGCRFGFLRPLSACRVWVKCRHRQAVRVGFCFVVVGFAGLQSVFYGWVVVLARCGKRFRASRSRLWSVWRSWCFRVVRLCGVADFSGSSRVSSIHAQQASQRDCPPFRLAKLVFYQR